jgi:methyl-accepting chemotaxis protein
MESMTQIRRTVEDAADKIGELGESGKRIGNIVEVIRQISEQTSLLALNASIEAAHAGEQGRGFAVVADEVSSLARRVGQSAKDIEDLIATIKDQTSDAVHTMQAGTKGVESGTALVTSTLGNLKQIIEMVQETAGAVQEQAIVSDEIARNMDAVQKIANEVLASSEEAVIQGEQLHALAYHLEESVRGFNLEGEDAPQARSAPPPPAAPPAPRRAIASSASGHRRRSALRPAARPPTNGGGKA